MNFNLKYKKETILQNIIYIFIFIYYIYINVIHIFNTHTYIYIFNILKMKKIFVGFLYI